MQAIIFRGYGNSHTLQLDTVGKVRNGAFQYKPRVEILWHKGKPETYAYKVEQYIIYRGKVRWVAFMIEPYEEGVKASEDIHVTDKYIVCCNWPSISVNQVNLAKVNQANHLVQLAIKAYAKMSSNEDKHRFVAAYKKLLDKNIDWYFKE